MLSVQRLKEFYHYDPDTGMFTRIKKASKYGPNVSLGKAIGSINASGYRVLRVDYTLYRVARLAWLYMTGDWPSEVIDHIDGDTLNDRWINLRDVSRSENMWNTKLYNNNASGISGVFWNTYKQKWCIQLASYNQNHVIGFCDTLEEAQILRDEAAKRLHGEFDRFAPLVNHNLHWPQEA